MKPLNGDRIQEIFLEALSLPQSERSAFVAKTCANDADLARKINSLLAAHDSPGILETPVVRLHFLPDNLAKTTIDGRYFIERELGGGGMSQVYLAHDRKVNNRLVVIKFLAMELLQNSYARQKFKQESEALSRIRHANVVEVMDTGELADGRPYFVMQYVDGETLRSQVSSGGMDMERAASILKQIGAALEHAHQQGVLHRDLKPENILLRRVTDDVVVIDFGIAKVTDSVVAPTTKNEQSAGTLMYMSPEQLRGERVAATSDIYSMGVIAYEMVTGRRPFNTDSPARLLELQKKGVRAKPRRLREELPAKAETIILRALSFDSGARYQHAREFGESLADALLERIPKGPWPKVIRASLILIGAALISLAIYKIIYWPHVTEPSRSFSYFLMVQKMRDGQPYKEPYKSHGENEIFENGDKFQLTVSTPVPAYLYIFNEGPPGPNDSFTMIYPNQAINKGSPSLGANQSVQSNWITFSGPTGAQNVWIVWSTAPVGELEALTSEAPRHPEGVLTGQTLVKVKQYLTANEAEIDATTYNYNENRTAVVRGKRGLLVALAQFKHR
jgi:serine/threonine protein kinase